MSGVGMEPAAIEMTRFSPSPPTSDHRRGPHADSLRCGSLSEPRHGKCRALIGRRASLDKVSHRRCQSIFEHPTQQSILVLQCPCSLFLTGPQLFKSVDESAPPLTRSYRRLEEWADFHNINKMNEQAWFGNHRKDSLRDGFTGAKSRANAEVAHILPHATSKEAAFSDIVLDIIPVDALIGAVRALF